MQTCIHTLHTYIHTYIHTCMHACMHPCIHASMHPCIHASMHPRIHASMHPCIHASMHPCIHACMHAYIRTYIHTDRHTGIHTYIHTYGQKLRLLSFPQWTCLVSSSAHPFPIESGHGALSYPVAFPPSKSFKLLYIYIYLKKGDNWPSHTWHTKRTWRCDPQLTEMDVLQSFQEA